MLLTGITSPSVFLLDFYPGAHAGYSLQKLKSSATNAVRVRRSSDNAQQDIGFAGVALDTHALQSFIGVSDAYVVTWYDQSGNARDVTNATPAQQPQIAAAGAVIKDVKNNNALKFDGVQQYLTRASYAGAPQFISTVFTMLDRGCLLGLSGAVQLWYTGAGTISIAYATINDTLSTPIDNVPHQASVDIAAVKLYLDSVLKDTKTTLTNTYNRIYIGSQAGIDSFFKGYCNELIIWDNVQTANRLAIDQAVMSKYHF